MGVTVILNDKQIVAALDHITAQLVQLNVSATSIAASLVKLAAPEPGSIVVTHSESIKEKEMSKPAKLVMKAPSKKAGPVPVADTDTVTISVLDNSTPPVPYPGPLTFTIAPVSADTTMLTTDQPVGPTYGEHFLKAGTVNVVITATFSDGTTVLTLTDTVTITGVPGSLVATHSLPVAGP